MNRPYRGAARFIIRKPNLLQPPDIRVPGYRFVVIDDVGYQPVGGREREPDAGVGGAVVNRDPAGRRVGERRAREDDVVDESVDLEPLLRGEDVVSAAVEHLRRFVAVEDRAAHAVNVAVAGLCHAVVDQEPADIGLDRRGTSADLERLPPPASALRHDVAVTAPVDEIGALAQEDVAEGGVPAVARAREQEEFAVHLPREEHAVPVEREEGVFVAHEALEIRGRSQSKRGAVEIGTPDDVVRVLDLEQARVVRVQRVVRFAVGVGEADRIGFDRPRQRVGAVPEVEEGAPVRIFGAEHTDEPVFPRDDGAVENAGDVRGRIPSDDRVGAVPPQGSVLSGIGRVLPRDGREIAAENVHVHDDGSFRRDVRIRIPIAKDSRDRLREAPCVLGPAVDFILPRRM